MPTKLRSEMLERRRLRAAQLHERGWRVKDIAHALQVSSAAVSQWLAAYHERGTDGLIATPKTGAPSRLTKRDMTLLRALLKDKPSDHGIEAEVWDRSLLQLAIKRLFGVTFSLQHVGRLRKQLETNDQPLPKVVSVELHDLLRKSDIARIRSRISSSHGKRRR